jgi:hypothetical protein
MAVHDWSRVTSGLFHHFHQMWIGSLCNALNANALPAGYYALAEQSTGGLIPDVLTLQSQLPADSPTTPTIGVAVADAPPRTRYISRAEQDLYVAKADRIAIRHSLGHVVSVIEIVSPGNKSSRTALRHFVDKAVGLLDQGVHLLIVDLFPPSSRDPQGIHKALWDEILEEPFALPDGKPLTLAAYSAGTEAAGVATAAYVEPVGVGDLLTDMPLFLESEIYIPVPLEATYQTTWSTCPAPFRSAVSSRAENNL